MNDIENVSDKIFIPLSNRMSGKVRIIGLGMSEIRSTITVANYIDLTSKLVVYSDQIVINPSYPPTLGNQKRGSIRIPFRKDVSSTISISPKNKMSAKVTVIEPPTYHMELDAKKDAFIRSNIATLNYGTEQSMVVGYSIQNDEKFRSLVQFDISQIPPNAKIKHAALKLYNNRVNSGVHQVGVFTSSTPWDEYGVTWANQPAIKDIVSISRIGEIGYASFDVTDRVLDWYSNNESNNGFIIKAMNENYGQSEQFSTRESPVNKPLLEITYKLDIIYSFGRSDINSAIFVKAVGSSTIKGTINIPQYNSSSDLDSRIHVRNLNWMLEESIIINKPSLPSRISIRQKEDSALPSTLSVRVKGGYLPSDNRIGKIIVNARDQIGKIRIPSNSSIPSQIHVRVWSKDYRQLNSKITINKTLVKSSIIIRQKDSSSITGSIQPKLHKHLNSSIHINRPDVIGSLIVSYSRHVNGSLHVKQTDHMDGHITIPERKNLPGQIDIVYADHIPSQMKVLSGYLRSRIVIPAYGQDDRIATMKVRAKYIKEINGTITVGGDNLAGGYVYIM
ncbi:DNRLRE domain-containing protein [Paenibacillus sp. NPDC058174]|uniref:DNRLRE domain-containing protein n=1 Tax=Paenibacillus sp. NPDC058174 TaxID=3346366 RepID=UPI0036D87DD4